MTKREVCEFLGKSKRTVEKYMAEGRLVAEYVEGPNGKQLAFDRASAERTKRDLETPIPRTVSPTEEYFNQGNLHLKRTIHPVARPPVASTSDPFDGLAAQLAKLATGFPSAAPVLGNWVSLEEAATRSGLPKSYLVAQAKAGAPFALNVSASGKRASWRFRV
jgi:hypothetical protein